MYAWFFSDQKLWKPQLMQKCMHVLVLTKYIHVTKSTKIIIHFGNGLTSGTTNHLDKKPKINLSTPTSDGMEIMAS